MAKTPPERPLLDLDGLKAIEALYDAPLRADAWQDFLAIIRARFGAHSVFLAFRLRGEDEDSLQIQASQGDIQAFTDRYFSRFTPDNPFRYQSMVFHRIYCLEDFIPGGGLADSILYQEHLKPEGLGTVEIVKIGRQEGPTAYLAWIRRKEQGGLAEADRAWLSGLLSHADRAVAVFSRFRLSQRVPELLAEIFDRLSYGALAISRSSRVLFSNSLAHALIEGNDAVSIRQDRLVLHDSAQARLIARLAAEPHLIDSLPIDERVLSLGKGDSRIAALIMPIDARDVFDMAIPANIMIYLHDLRSTAHASPALVAKLFGLAPAEARLVILLGEGLTLREAAARLGITENSARSYSKTIFHKTGMKRQADIVRLVQRSMALFTE